MKRERQTTSDLCPKCGASWDCEHGARKPEKKRRPDVADEIAANIAAGAAAHPRRYLTWGEKADEVLSRIFDNGNFTPSPQEIFDAYPFGMRKYWPYLAISSSVTSSSVRSRLRPLFGFSDSGSKGRGGSRSAVSAAVARFRVLLSSLSLSLSDLI